MNPPGDGRLVYLAVTYGIWHTHWFLEQTLSGWGHWPSPDSVTGLTDLDSQPMSRVLGWVSKLSGAGTRPGRFAKLCVV